MHVISKKKLRDFWSEHKKAEDQLGKFFRVASGSNWNSFADVKETFRSADRVGQFVVFDICNNDFRVIAYIDYRKRKVFIRSVLTHAEYDRDEWKKDEWFKRPVKGRSPKSRTGYRRPPRRNR